MTAQGLGLMANSILGRGEDAALKALDRIGGIRASQGYCQVNDWNPLLALNGSL